jgi:transposase
MGQVAVYSGVERRRRWDDETRLKILSEAFSPGANIAQVARDHDVSTGQIYTWRRKLLEASAGSASMASPDPGFAEAVRVEDPPSVRADLSPAMVIDLARDQRVSIFASASPALVAAALKALR